MLQFGSVTYQNSPDYDLSMEFIRAYKSGADINTSLRVLFNAIRLNPNIGKAYLILCRLYSWRIINPDIFIHESDRILSAVNFNAADLFEKQEIYSCIGENLLWHILGEDFDSSALQDNYKSPLSHSDFVGDGEFDHGPESEALDVWIYVPPPTGFFSVLENVVMAKFYCELHQKVFVLDTRFDWWVYPVNFFDIFQAQFNRVIPSNAKNIHQLDWETLRDVAKRMDVKVAKRFAKFKAKEFCQIRKKLTNYHNSTFNNSILKNYSCVVFIRGGDKTLYETVESPISLLLRDIANVCVSGLEVHILSDDFDLAENLRHILNLAPEFNLTESRCSGYFHSRKTNAVDVNTIISNYLTLSGSAVSISCPSSNLVDAAHWSNLEINKFRDLKSTPVSRYIYL